MSSELYYAHMEADRNEAMDAYFEARPFMDSDEARQVFRAGYERAYLKLWNTSSYAAALLSSAPESQPAPLLGELKAQGVSGMSASALTACGNRTAPIGSQEGS